MPSALGSPLGYLAHGIRDLLGPHHRFLWLKPLGDGPAVAAALLTLQAHAMALIMCRCQWSGMKKCANDSLTIQEKCRLRRSESGLINRGIESFSIDFCQTLLTAKSDCMNVTHRLCWQDSSHANLYGGYDLCSKSPQPQSGRVL